MYAAELLQFCFLPLDWLGEVVTHWINGCVSLLGVTLWRWDICKAWKDERELSFQVPATHRTQRKAGQDWYVQHFEGCRVEADWLLLFLEFLVFAWKHKFAIFLVALMSNLVAVCGRQLNVACSLALSFMAILCLLIILSSTPTARGSCGHRTELPCAGCSGGRGETKGNLKGKR